MFDFGIIRFGTGGMDMSYFYYKASAETEKGCVLSDNQPKRLYYQETGKGKPVVFLHGNTASSRMFEPLLPLYEDRFRVILVDFLGNGRSDRTEAFPPDLWQDEGRQVAALLEHLKLGKACLVGCSGGAWAAINAGLMRPDLVEAVAADSFDGRTLAGDFAEKLLAERTAAKKDEQAVGFYRWCQGDDWEQVVDKDTEALVQCAKRKLPLFVKPLSELKVPLLLMGSLEDTMTRNDLRQEYEAAAAETGGKVCLFARGGHPALYSNAEAAAEEICRFFEGRIMEG